MPKYNKPVFVPLVFLIIACLGLTACSDGQSTSVPITVQQAVVTAGSTASVAPATTGTTLASTASTSLPATSAAGYPGKIVYETSNHEIFLINPDGSGRTRLAGGSYPLFSSDGSRVAFLSQNNQGSTASVRSLVSSVTLSGADRQDYCDISGNGSYTLTAWSPSRRYIMVSGSLNGPGVLQLCRLEDKKLFEPMTTIQGNLRGVYDWQADGKFALWQAGSDGRDLNLYYGEVDKNGEGAQALTKSQYRFEITRTGFKFYQHARLSPDGRTIAVVGSKLFFLSVPGQKSPLDGKIVEGFQAPNWLVWSPDGKTLAVTDGTSLKLLDIAGGKITTLVDQAGPSDWH